MYPTRPGILTFMGVVSLIWSATTLVGVIVGAFFPLLVGMGSWFLGPIAGAIGTMLALVIFAWMVASSILSILLFNAGWKTLHDNPDGIRLHRLWAWISLAIDAIALLGSGGTLPNSWAGVIYAVGVLYVTGMPEIRDYYWGDPQAKPGKPGGWGEEFH